MKYAISETESQVSVLPITYPRPSTLFLSLRLLCLSPRCAFSALADQTSCSLTTRCKKHGADQQHSCRLPRCCASALKGAPSLLSPRFFCHARVGASRWDRSVLSKCHVGLPVDNACTYGNNGLISAGPRERSPLLGFPCKPHKRHHAHSTQTHPSRSGLLLLGHLRECVYLLVHPQRIFLTICDLCKFDFGLL